MRCFLPHEDPAQSLFEEQRWIATTPFSDSTDSQVERTPPLFETPIPSISCRKRSRYRSSSHHPGLSPADNEANHFRALTKSPFVRSIPQHPTRPFFAPFPPSLPKAQVQRVTIARFSAPAAPPATNRPADRQYQ